MSNLWSEYLNVYPSPVAECQIRGRTNRYNSFIHKTDCFVLCNKSIQIVLTSIQVITEHFKMYVHCTPNTKRVFLMKSVLYSSCLPTKHHLCYSDRLLMRKRGLCQVCQSVNNTQLTPISQMTGPSLFGSKMTYISTLSVINEIPDIIYERFYVCTSL